MSSSTNLYSADDSDRDSFSDELTPTDGYFNRGQRVSPNRTVQDPSVDSKPEPKTLISPPHLRSTGGASGSSLGSSDFHPSSPPARRALSPPSIDTRISSSSNVPYSLPSSGASTPTQNMYSEESPLVSGPPPAYSPNPTSPSVPRQVIEHRYSTFPQEEGGFTPARAPESMGQPVDNVNERSPAVKQPRSPLHRIINKVRDNAGKSIIALLIFIGAFVTLTHFATKQSSTVCSLYLNRGTLCLDCHDSSSSCVRSKAQRNLADLTVASIQPSQSRQVAHQGCTRQRQAC